MSQSITNYSLTNYSLTDHPITNRPLRSEEDFWRVRNLLIETYPLTPLGFNWEVRRWDGSRFHNEVATWQAQLTGRVQLWETAAGRLVGVVNREGDDDAHLQIHPDFRQLEAEMIDWAETHWATSTPAGARQLEFYVFEYDTQRQQLLSARGYQPTPHGGVSRRLHLADRALTAPTLAAGYTLRTTQPADLANCQRIADLLNAAFKRDFHTAREFQLFTELAPCYRPESDLVAVAPDGSFAAYVGVAYEPVNRHATFEPVCTHPDHRQRGLAQALMLEGLRRSHALGARDIIVETSSAIPANRLYDSIGFSEVAHGQVWRKMQ